MADKKLIFWDIDGTLLHCGSDGRKALNRTFHELYDIGNAFGSSDIGGAMDSMILDGIMTTHGVDSGQLPNIIKHYQGVLEDILNKNKRKQILPGIPALLEAIDSNNGYVNALLTSNLKIGAMTKLNSVGLGHYFQLGGFGDEPGEKWDAARACILEAEEMYDTKFTEMYLVGDSIYDIVCAQEVGMISIAVGTGWSTEEALLSYGPNYYFHDLSDTDRVLKAMKF